MTTSNHTGATRPETSFGATVSFTFEGRRLSAPAGSSIAAGLFHNGIRTLSWSVKFHRPRSIQCGRGRCVGCLVEVDGKPGVKSCLTALREGAEVRRQDFRPFYGSLLQETVRRLPMPAGFYFRFFTRPSLVRRLFLGSLRRMAGVGRLDLRATTPAPPSDVRHIAGRYDVVVIGGGLSGLAAADAAANGGASVLLVDENDFRGGSTAGRAANKDDAASRDRLVAAIDANARVTTVHGATAQGFYEPDRFMLSVQAGDRVMTRRVRARAAVFAMGTGDLTPLFANNDLPGIFGLRALRLFLERDGIRIGKRAVVYGTEPEIEDAERLLAAHGIETVASVVAADTSSGGRTTGTLLSAGGSSWVERAVFSTPQGERRYPCDIICLALPGQPAFELAQQAGCRFAFDNTSRPDVRVMRPEPTDIASTDCSIFIAGTQAGVSGGRRVEHGSDCGQRAAEAAR